MNFNSFLNTIFFSGILTFFSCLGENSWEDLESDYDHVLNVFGLISLDSLQPSYVGLYSTTDLDDISRIFGAWLRENTDHHLYWTEISSFQPDRQFFEGIYRRDQNHP